jgi:monofunctional biosynthetic peptidoglycan transglycosylase
LWAGELPVGQSRRGRWKKIGKVFLGAAAVGGAVAGYGWLTLPDVRPLKAQNPSQTAFMRLRIDEARRAGKALSIRHRWVGYERIAWSLKRAVQVSEDAGFWAHDGIDYAELRLAVARDWQEGRPFRGASTMTQQLAKNRYLSPARTPMRKFRELMLTRRLEAELGKRRIFELYLNVIEWGDGIFGAEAAARAYFGVGAGELSVEQAALLAGAIINPRVYSPAHPNARLRSRQQIILSRMN